MIEDEDKDGERTEEYKSIEEDVNELNELQWSLSIKGIVTLVLFYAVFL